MHPAPNGTLTTPPPAKPRRRWRWFALVGIILLPLAWVGYFKVDNEWSQAAAEAEADRTDPGWRMRDILLARRAVPDAENSAPRIIAIAAKTRGGRIRQVEDYETLFAKTAPNLTLTPHQVGLIREELEKIGMPLPEARDLRKHPYGRFSITLEPILFMTRLPDHPKAGDLADCLRHDAYLLAHEGKIAEALQSCQACLCCGRVMGDEPMIVSHILRRGIQRDALAALERALGQGEADERTLRDTQTLFEMEVEESNWLQALRGERAGGVGFFESLRTGKVTFTSLFAGGKSGPARTAGDWIADRAPSTVMRYFPDYLRHMTRCVEAARLPLHEQRAPMRDLDRQLESSNNRVLTSLCPSMVVVHDAECRSQAGLRTAVAALACERYRLKEGRWPATLDDLVRAGLIHAVPVDPIDGAPLRYRHQRDAIVIYSIGNDEKDDGGNLLHESVRESPGADLGIRLWAVSSRRR